ncbi:hypothetical protein JW835_04670 [bacterium]|nr:hypothetical protein [bacterium]
MHHAKYQCGFGCGCQDISGSLWSTEKKIRVLQQRLEALTVQKQDIESLIDELKNEK